MIGLYFDRNDLVKISNNILGHFANGQKGTCQNNPTFFNTKDKDATSIVFTVETLAFAPILQAAPASVTEFFILGKCILLFSSWNACATV